MKAVRVLLAIGAEAAVATTTEEAAEAAEAERRRGQAQDAHQHEHRAGHHLAEKKGEILRTNAGIRPMSARRPIPPTTACCRDRPAAPEPEDTRCRTEMAKGCVARATEREERDVGLGRTNRHTL